MKANESKARKDVNRMTPALATAKAKLAAAKPVPPKNSPLRTRVRDLTTKLNAANAKLTSSKAQISAIGIVITLEANAVALVPTGIGTALSVYRHAVSDHLPITTNVTF